MINKRSYGWNRAIPVLMAALAAAVPRPIVASTIYAQINLVSDIPGFAAVTDTNLHNPWGVSFGAATPFWVSDQGTGVSTLYTGAGVPNALVVTTPPSGTPPTGPTGQVFANLAGNFLLNGTPSTFIFSTLAGTVDAWNGGTTATVEHTTTGAVYTGLALDSNAGSNLLFAANFAAKKIDVFDSTFTPTTVTGTFSDGTVPATFSPYNIQNINGLLYVEYAEPGTGGATKGAGLGYLRVFNPNGTLAAGAPSISAGVLNAPWGVTLAPSGFGDFSGDLLVGNFGDGTINAFSPTTGAFLGTVAGVSGPLLNGGLWSLSTRTAGPNVNTSAVYLTAGINNEADGVFAEIVMTPEPGTVVLAAAGLLGLAIRRYRRRSSR